MTALTKSILREKTQPAWNYFRYTAPNWLNRLTTFDSNNEFMYVVAKKWWVYLTNCPTRPTLGAEQSSYHQIWCQGLIYWPMYVYTRSGNASTSRGGRGGGGRGRGRNNSNPNQLTHKVLKDCLKIFRDQIPLGPGAFGYQQEWKIRNRSMPRRSEARTRRTKTSLTV